MIAILFHTPIWQLIFGSRERLVVFSGFADQLWSGRDIVQIECLGSLVSINTCHIHATQTWYYTVWTVMVALRSLIGSTPHLMDCDVWSTVTVHGDRNATTWTMAEDDLHMIGYSNITRCFFTHPQCRESTRFSPSTPLMHEMVSSVCVPCFRFLTEAFGYNMPVHSIM